MRQSARSRSYLCPCFLIVLAMAPPAWAQASTPGGQPADAAPAVSSPDGVWTILDQVAQQVLAEPGPVRPPAGRSFTLSLPSLTNMLGRAPMENASPVRTSTAIIELPAPDGTFQRFAFVESPIMEPGLAAQVPQIRTYLGQGLDDPSATVRFDITPQGFHAQVIVPDRDLVGARRSFFIDPLSHGDTTHYVSYARSDLAPAPDWQCSTPQPVAVMAPRALQQAAPADATITRRVLRLAVAATGEYTAAASAPSQPNAVLGFSAITTAINRVNQILENDLAVRLVLVSGSLNIVYTNAATDPYSGSQSSMQSQNQTNLDSVIGSDNYDIGHLFHSLSNGLAGNAGGIGTICASNKASAISASSTLTGDYFDIDLVAHEMGHQLGATHTFNGTNGSCGDAGQYTSSSAYEPGGGTTIMSYNGGCGTDDIPTNLGTTGWKFPMYNFSSISQIANKLAAGGCGTSESTTNHPPSAILDPGWVLPTNTPFTLSGVGADTDFGNALSYSWEQADLGPQLALGPDTGQGEPLFRDFMHIADDTRTFPQMFDVLAGTTTPGEYLPQFARASSKYRLVVRDNVAGAGGTGIAELAVQFVQVPGGFKVTAPAAGVGWCSGGTGQVIWNVANTNLAPISCSRVDIRLSVNGGVTFPYILFDNATNTGFATVTVPPAVQDTTTARVIVRARDNVFFSLSPSSFKVVAGPPIILTQPANLFICAPGAYHEAWLTFTTAGGGSATFAWYKDGQFLRTTSGPDLSFYPPTRLDTGDYYCVVTNGCGTVTSATVRVQVGVSFDQQPASQTVPACTPAAFSVLARGVGPLTYQWQRDGAPITDDARVTGSHTATLNIASARFDDEGVYSCAVTDSCETLGSVPALLSISTLPVWVQRSPAHAPSPRYYYGLVYDTLRQKTVLVGGTDNYSNNSRLFGDTWEWDGADWTQKATGGITPRYGAAAAFDSVHGRTIVFGGDVYIYYGLALSGETWEWDGTSWTLTATSGPSPRNGASMAFDPTTEQVFLFGGYTGSGYPADTWSYNTTTHVWTLVTTAFPLGFVLSDTSRMAYDPGRGRLVLSTEGYFDSSEHFYEWTGSAWAQVLNTSQSFRGHSLSFDTDRDLWVLATGYTNSGPNLNTWVYRSATAFQPYSFTQFLNSGPTPFRYYSSMAYDRDRKAQVLFGGSLTSGSSPIGDTWELISVDVVQILEHPKSQPLTPGSDASFTVLAVGAGNLSYQWRFNGVLLNDGPAAGGGTISGAATPQLSIGNTQAADYGAYTCLVSNACGSLTSNAALLGTVPADLNSDSYVDAGDVALFVACLTGPDIPYNPVSLPPGCTLTPDTQGHIAADLDRDGDVDLDDFGTLQKCFSGAGRVADPLCAD